MKNNNIIILKAVTKIVIPYILLFAIYIQVNGEVSPGGGFQAGAILASTTIGYNIIYSNKLVQQDFKVSVLIITAALGVTIYGLTGIIAFLKGNNYLNYYSIVSEGVIGQYLGIFIIELGVGLTVASSLLIIYYMFLEQE